MYKVSLSFIVAVLSLVPAGAFAARISLDPEQGVFGKGDTFIVAVRVHTESECINAAHVALQYSPQVLRAVDFSRGDSVLSLWVEEPVLNTDTGVVTFSGGIPGGYCGRIQGDPAQSNILGKVVFTVVGDGDATVTVSSSTALYMNDGRGTLAKLTSKNAHFSLAATPTQTENPWLAEVSEDTTPPDPFEVQVQSTRNVFGGRYYLVFTTLDKQSGLDHFEILENNNWKTVTSPYSLPNQFLQGLIQVRAIDKAGNERIGDYTPGSEPSRAVSLTDLYVALGVLVVIIGIGFARLYLKKRRSIPGSADV